MTLNHDQDETGKFAELAENWWDPRGPLRTLHEINPPRLSFIKRHASLTGQRVLDVGCGGGILAEALAANGALVTGIDLAEPLIQVAITHASQSGQRVDYQCVSSAAFAASHARAFDVVCCMELLEHVPDPDQLVMDCSRLLAKAGVAIFATINRTPRAFFETIVAGEYLFSLLPRGTHGYEHYIRPSELSGWCRTSGLEPIEISGLRYAPLTSRHRITANPAVNYLLAARRSGC